jgi:hypothetical protein
MFVLEGCSDRHPGQHRDVSMRSVILVLEEVIAATIEVPVGDVCMRSYLGRYALFAPSHASNNGPIMYASGRPSLCVVYLVQYMRHSTKQHRKHEYRTVMKEAYTGFRCQLYD